MILRLTAMMAIGIAGAALGVEGVETTLAAWWIGVVTSALILFILEGA